MRIPHPEEGDVSHPWRTYKRVLGYARPYLWRLVLGIGAGLVSGASALGLLNGLYGLFGSFDQPEKAAEAGPILRWLTTHIDISGLPLPDQENPLTLKLLLAGVLMVWVFYFMRASATWMNRYFMRWVGARAIMDLRNELFGALQRQSLAFYGRIDTGQLISRCVTDTTTIDSAVSGTIADLSRAPVEVAAAVGFIIAISVENELYLFPIAAFVLMPLCILPLILLARRVKRYFKRALHRISNLVSRMHETFTGIRVVKAFHTEEAEMARFRGINANYFRQVLRAVKAELMMTPMIEFVTVILISFFLVYCWHMQVKLSQILVLTAALFLTYDPLKRLAKVVTQVQRSMAGAERVFELLDTHTEIQEAENPLVVTDFEQDIRFDNVSFAYDDALVLRDIDLTIGRGRIVAAVGGTGSGKTTMANLLARFYDPTRGRVLLDGTDLREIETASLRRLIGVVTQETILFNDTIANNIAYGSPEATLADIIEAAKQANAHDFIMAEAQGYDRVVGEKGFVLSGGQRQRVAIARAILRNPQILILDEATSALDTVTEQLVQEALNRVMKDRTVFAIAHRLSTIRHADRIIVLEGGRIVESGTHDELVAHGGLYSRLSKMQFQG